MKTLVIHPKDKSTDFLKPIYDGIEDKTVITGGLTQEQIHELIGQHDRIIMMGHGCPLGLFGVFQFPKHDGLIIDVKTVPFLKNKDCFFIWCNADKFVNHYGLKGFYSGMFISEVEEAYGCYIPHHPNMKEIVNESNDGFSKILGENINNQTEDVFYTVKRLYETLADSNLVAKYNYDRLYHNK